MVSESLEIKRTKQVMQSVGHDTLPLTVFLVQGHIQSGDEPGMADEIQTAASMHADETRWTKQSQREGR